MLIATGSVVHSITRSADEIGIGFCTDTYKNLNLDMHMDSGKYASVLWFALVWPLFVSQPHCIVVASPRVSVTGFTQIFLLKLDLVIFPIGLDLQKNTYSGVLSPFIQLYSLYFFLSHTLLSAEPQR